MKPPVSERPIHQRDNGAVIVGKGLLCDIESKHGGVPEGWGDLTSGETGEERMGRTDVASHEPQREEEGQDEGEMHGGPARESREGWR